MSYSYIFFYRYENGTEGFGFYNGYEEANERMTEFAKDSEKYNSKVQFGIAEIADYGNVDLEKAFIPCIESNEQPSAAGTEAVAGLKEVTP